MNRMPNKFIAIVAAVAVLSAGGGYWFAHRGEASDQSHASMASSADRQALYWFDPMYPNQHFDKPGKSPFMDMELVPKYANDAGDTASVRIDPSIVQNLGVRTTLVERGTLSQPLDAVGSIGFNQRNVAVVQARASGFVSRVYARAPGDVLERGAPLVDLLIPEWSGAQAEFLALLKTGNREFVEAARERLRLLGMSTELIERVEAQREPQTTITIRTPIAGAIESLDVREGMTVSSGATLAKINGLQTMWLEAAIPEAQGSVVSVGKPVEARLTAYSDQVFAGKVISVLPETNAETRTLRVRIELPNPDGKLKPGMFAQVRLEAGKSESALYVASEAVIRSGTRNIVLLVDEQGRFTPTELRVGTEANGKTVVLEGLSEGQKVVASGQFLIDSEASLKGVLARLAVGSEPKDGMPPQAESHEATGKVESIAVDKIVLSHGPVASLNWPSMTMGFKPESAEVIAKVKSGDNVWFKFQKVGDDFIVTEMKKTEDAR
jgi:Cu(I)/Ag(I) efflux system membrane fusion protein